MRASQFSGRLRFRNLFLRVSLGCALGAVVVSGSSGADDLNLEQIAVLPYPLFSAVVCGDTDHDGRQEVALYRQLGSDYLCQFYERADDGTYSLAATGGPAIPYAIGDLDGDGKMEVMGQNGHYIEVYESADEGSHPTNLVWQSPYLQNVIGYPTVGDTDGDGRMEIIHTNYTGSDGTESPTSMASGRSST
ncbi:MAG: VCBS repeat-containing protein [Candidatus Eisenbacteria bacterium]